MASSAPQPLLLLIDGHSLAFRSYYAFAKSRDGGLKTSTGIPTSICFGFLKSLFEVLSQQTPQALAIAFDRGKETFRHQADPNYKANRQETPDDFVPDIENLQQILTALQIPIASSAGYEADDILATLAERGAATGYRVKILTGDRDLFQLVDAEKLISVLYLRGGSQNRDNTAYEYDPIQVQEKMGVTPEQVVDYKALCGDTSDNIPGVRGIGDKTAVKLLKEYGTLDGVYQAIDTIKGAIQKKLVAGKDDAYHSQFLAQIIRDVELELPLDNCKLQGFDPERVSPLFASLELQTFSKQLDKLQELFGGQVPTKPGAIAIAEQESEELFFWTAEDTEAAQKEKELPFVPEIINTPDKLTDLVQRLQGCMDANRPVAWDTETTDLDPRMAKLVGVGCCFAEARDKEPTVAYLPLNHKEGKNLDCDRAIDLLRPLLEDSNSTKIFQNAKFDRLVFQNYDITLQGKIFDTLLASYILNPDGAHNLSALAQQELKIISQSYTELVPKGKTIADIDISLVAGYCGMDVYAAFHLCDRFQQKLANFPKLEQLLTDIELPLEPVLAKMEWMGIRIDSDYLNTLSEQLAEQLETIKTNAHKIAGEDFNLGSPKQVSSILFDKLQLPTRKSRKIKTGYSTDAATLEKLESDDTTGVVRAILDYRTLDKLKSTYVDALPQLVHPQTQRVHTDFNQAVTSTGRLSSSNPNLQNIPIRTEFSRQIRKAFIPEAGWILAAADYSQIELRILAHLSGEPTLIDAYQNQRDIHAVTAQLLFDREDITPEERRLGKVINFGVIYGMGAQRFAREAGVSTIEGKEFIDRFNRQYPQVFAYLEQVKQEAIAQGYVETIFGRRRYFNFESLELKKQLGKPVNEISLKGIRLGRNDAGMLRAAANAPIQGSSADLIKIAMVKLDKVLENYQGRLLLQVHDELVLEMPEHEWEKLSSDIKITMESAAALDVPLVADINHGNSWMTAK